MEDPNPRSLATWKTHEALCRATSCRTSTFSVSFSDTVEPNPPSQIHPPSCTLSQGSRERGVGGVQLAADTPRNKRGRCGSCLDSICNFENEVRCKRMHCNDVRGTLSCSEAAMGDKIEESTWKGAATCNAFASHACRQRRGGSTFGPSSNSAFTTKHRALGDGGSLPCALFLPGLAPRGLVQVVVSRLSKKAFPCTPCPTHNSPSLVFGSVLPQFVVMGRCIPLASMAHVFTLAVKVLAQTRPPTLRHRRGGCFDRRLDPSPSHWRRTRAACGLELARKARNNRR